jgi:hypothetical protein
MFELTLHLVFAFAQGVDCAEIVIGEFVRFGEVEIGKEGKL